MGGVITGFGVIASIIAAGYVLGRSDALGANGREVLTRVAFSVATPALLFTILSGADPSALFSAPLAVTALSMAAAAALFVAVAVVRRWGARTAGMGALCSAYVNAGNLGIPIASYVLGDAALVAPVLLLQQLVVTPIAVTLLDAGSRSPGERVGVLTVLTTPLRNPIAVASLAGVAVALSGLTVPDPLMQPFELVGSMSVPAVLLALGISLHGSPLPGRGPERGPVVLAVVLKTLLQPAAAWAIGTWLFQLDGEMLFAVVVLAALPTAQNVFTYASRYGAATTMVREAVLLSTIATLPVLVGIALLHG
ncbi:AEC family transporter [Nocardiopsis baichengensis]|uniref:AEC family transporter n=1 Tax=Nocardiopsis baichengensis TaxID=280240 RepID=UPI0003490393|nr:AEC family transporter [Nocardiopsis baichengensis]